jgi:hypothetical protein
VAQSESTGRLLTVLDRIVDSTLAVAVRMPRK